MGGRAGESQGPGGDWEALWPGGELLVLHFQDFPTMLNIMMHTEEMNFLNLFVCLFVFT